MNGWTVRVEYQDGRTETVAPCAYPVVSAEAVLHLNVGWTRPTEHVSIPLANIHKWTAKQDCIPPEGEATEENNPIRGALSDQRLISAFARGLP